MFFPGIVSGPPITGDRQRWRFLKRSSAGPLFDGRLPAWCCFTPLPYTKDGSSVFANSTGMPVSADKSAA